MLRFKEFLSYFYNCGKLKDVIIKLVILEKKIWMENFSMCLCKGCEGVE